jgi:hypothetical protein
VTCRFLTFIKLAPFGENPAGEDPAGQGGTGDRPAHHHHDHHDHGDHHDHDAAAGSSKLLAIVAPRWRPTRSPR